MGGMAVLTVKQPCQDCGQPIPIVVHLDPIGPDGNVRIRVFDGDYDRGRFDHIAALPPRSA